jgi:integrase
MGRKPTKHTNLPPHMRVRHRSGKDNYYYDAGGKPRKEIPLGQDYVAAIQKWAELEGGTKKTEFTFSDLEFKYTAEVIPKKAARTQVDNQGEMKSLRKYFCNPDPAPLQEITQMDVRKFLDWRTKKGTEATTRANRERALLSHMFNMAINWGMFAGVNPCTGVQGYTETGRDVYIENNIFDAVYESSCIPLQEACDLAYLTSQRPTDVTLMSETDIRDGLLEVSQEKTKVKLRISVEGELDILIKRIKARKSKHKVRSLRLIVNEYGRPLGRKAIEKRMRKAREKAIKKHPGLEEQIKNYQFRDLRAKGATDKADLDDIRAAQHLLGHSNITMTEHYVRKRKGQKVSPTR